MNSLRELRKFAGVTQSKAGRVARCSHGTIHNFEAGRAELSHRQLARLQILYTTSIAARVQEGEQLLARFVNDPHGKLLDSALENLETAISHLARATSPEIEAP